MNQTIEGEIVTETLPAIRQGGTVAKGEWEIEDLEDQVRKIQKVMRSVMKEGEHYGVIPGSIKPSLLQPGAEKLALLFRIDPQFTREKTYDGDHLTVESTVVLYHIPTGQRIGSAGGMCSTKESKYAFRNASRICPKCGKETIIKGKAEYGGGHLCFAKKGGCGAKFADNDPAIISQPAGQVPNDKLPDFWQTVSSMADKRALVAAVKRCTAASDIFTQDIEENVKTRHDEAERLHAEDERSRAQAKPAERPACPPERPPSPPANGKPFGEMSIDEKAGTAAAEKAIVEAAKQRWKPFIESITTPAGATACIGEIEHDLKGDAAKAVKRMLHYRAKDVLGFEFDVKAMAYKLPAPPEREAGVEDEQPEPEAEPVY